MSKENELIHDQHYWVRRDEEADWEIGKYNTHFGGPCFIFIGGDYITTDELYDVLLKPIQKPRTWRTS
jgi:hypothetical protein